MCNGLVLSDFLHLASSLGRKGCVMPEVLILCGFAPHKLDRPLLLALCVCGELLSMEAVMLKAREHIPVQHLSH